MKIEAKAVEAVLSGSQILRGVDLEIGDRELVGVIGPNGSGKTTLLKCIYRVLKPAAGAVYLDGRALDRYPYKESARCIAVVAQHNYYNFDFSVRDVVLMGRDPGTGPGPADSLPDSGRAHEPSGYQVPAPADGFGAGAGPDGCRRFSRPEYRCHVL